MHIKFKKNGLTKEVKVGFSWTTFFLGVWVPLTRGMLVPSLAFFFTFGLAGLYYIFTINRVYAESLIEKGWQIVPDDVAAAKNAWGVGA